MPFSINDNLYKVLSQPCQDIHGNLNEPLWNQQCCTLRPTQSYSESDLADWLNLLSKVMGEALLALAYGRITARTHL